MSSTGNHPGDVGVLLTNLGTPDAPEPSAVRRYLAEFLSDPARNRLRDGRLEVSRIFDWYREDFDPLERYFARYAELLSGQAAGRKLILEGKAPLRFLDYDWTLNDSRSSSRR